ncbi:peptidyl-tRNA hydrolase [Myriangium duriaei CBS 260.36]|uniref:peptidyl-tRNA hydrolase n=1 Tax=Myriangium duriaei CBS 260.36 TaxID=1168546 RepID=A0A9P4MM68_9PEZI|nr:peptidyl-tRNA hydrolase [Myriangium duriaei CBS 260.36]
MAPAPHLFIASLGNPGAQYALTRHSAGHILLSALASHLGIDFSHSISGHPAARTTVLLPPPKSPHKQRRPKSPPDGSTPPPSPPPPAVEDRVEWTLFPSPAYMNDSGPAVLKAYKSHLRSSSPSDRPTRLIVLYDSLDHQPAALVLRNPANGLSAKGHNGIKSLLAACGADRDLRGLEWGRIGVGIGRGGGEKGSREAGDVSRWVLGRMRGEEVERLRGEVGRLRGLLEGIR